jgi:hypothetical protein
MSQVDCETMSRHVSFLLLVLAAALEVGGDALVRKGISAPSPLIRGALFGAGALVLFAYGYVVNAPPWDFGRLLGVYVVFIFLAAQALAWLVYGQLPSRGILIGGALIVAGGAIVAASAN